MPTHCFGNSLHALRLKKKNRLGTGSGLTRKKQFEAPSYTCCSPIQNLNTVVCGQALIEEKGKLNKRKQTKQEVLQAFWVFIYG